MSYTLCRPKASIQNPTAANIAKLPDLLRPLEEIEPTPFFQSTALMATKDAENQRSLD